MIKLGPKQLHKLESIAGKGWVRLENTPYEVRTELRYPVGYFDIRFAGDVKPSVVWGCVKGHGVDCVCLACLGIGR